MSPDGRWRWDGSKWVAVPELSGQPLAKIPSWAMGKLRLAAGWPSLAGVLGVALITDQALRSGGVGIALTLALAAAGVILLVQGRLQRLESRFLVAGAIAFGSFVSVRSSPWLLVPDLAMASLLLLLAASFAVRGSLFDLGFVESAARCFHAARHGVTGAWFLAPVVGHASASWKEMWSVLRGMLIALPIAAVLAALLAASDPVFASFLNPGWDIGQLVTDVIYVVLAALVMAGLLRLAAAEPVKTLNGPSWRLGTIEGLVVLGLLDIVFAAFALAQAVAASGTAGATLRAANVTYADYGRSGFFQLLWVAGITLVVLAVFSRITDRTGARGRIGFLVLAEIAIALTLLIVFVASRRLSLYEEGYGFTMLRLYSHAFAGLIGVIFLLLAADLAGLWPNRRWFSGSACVASLAVLMALNIVSPEALVAELNINHPRPTQAVDADYLSHLSSDAVPTLLDAGPRLDPAQQRKICAGPKTYSPYWGAYNWSDAEAAARRRSCRA